MYLRPDFRPTTYSVTSRLPMIRLDEQLPGVGGAREPADGVAGQAQLGGDIAEGAARGEQSVHVRVPGAGPVGDPPGPRCRGRQGRLRWQLGGRGRGLGRGRRKVLPVPGDRPLDGLAEVMPQVPAVCDLHRARRSPRAAIGIAAGPVGLEADNAAPPAPAVPVGLRVAALPRVIEVDAVFAPAAPAVMAGRRTGTHRHADHLATGMLPIVILMKIHIASELVGDTGIEPVTSSV